MVANQNIRISKSNSDTVGEIILGGSKSISNRVLILQQLCDDHFNIDNLSDSDDTATLEKLLKSDSNILDAHHAGTTFRFLTAYLSTTNNEVILTGSKRMQERPIKPLVDALTSLGASITYESNDGYPPLKIGRSLAALGDTVSLPANVSSQYISALLMIAPTIKNGLTITLEGKIVSRPYIEMTLRIMQYFGVSHSWIENDIIIKPQKYVAKDFFVESDWSAASYYYILATLTTGKVDITLHGLNRESLQADAAISDIATNFGIDTIYNGNSIRLIKNSNNLPAFFEYDFINCPDIAQSVSTMAAGLGVSLLMSGLITLRIKETDRIAALKKELKKMKVYLSKLPNKFSEKSNVEYYMLEGKIDKTVTTPLISTYNDHRMAMAFAPLSILLPINIEDFNVVSKSYPKFWEDMKILGVEHTLLSNE